MTSDTAGTLKTWRYAVVEFLTDSTYSEVPVTWLILNDGNSQCWWPPRTANYQLMIVNCTSPDYKTWDCYDVNVIRYCYSLESARKHASDANYKTTDDEQLGRGQRQHLPYNRFSSDEEECENSKSRKRIKKKEFDIGISKIPPCPENFGSKKIWTKYGQSEGATSLQEKRFNTSTAASELSSCSENLNDNEKANEAQNKGATSLQEKRFNISTVTSKSSSCYENLGLINNQEANNGQNEEIEELFSIEEQWQDIPILIQGYPPLPAIEHNNDENCSTKRSLRQLLRMQSASHLTLKDIRQRLVALENVIKNRALNLFENDDHLIAQLLPLATIDNIKEMDSILKTSNEAVTQFKQFVLKIGGNNSRDSIHRTLQKIFTNECAMKCSWKGIRNNFRLNDLNIMIIIKRQITLHHATLTESQFDNIAAEWFRFAKQRKNRETKDKENEN